jgi:outer membrane lipoprotein-sorting protein
MQPRALLLSFCMALSVASCVTSRQGISLDTENIDAVSLLRQVEQRGRKLTTMIGGGTVMFETPELSGTAAFDMKLKKPDSLLVVLEGPFGIDLGTLFISRERFVMYNSMENRVTTGIPTTRALRAVIPFDLTLDQVISIFSGSFPLPVDGEVLEVYRIDEDRFYLSFRCGSGTCSYWIDHESLIVRKYEIRDAHNRLILIGTTASISENANIYTPRRIVLKFPEERRQIAIHYTSLRLNEPDPSFDFVIPSNARLAIP